MNGSGASLGLRLESRVLGNGLTVVAVPDPSLPVVGLTVLYRVGSRHEERGRTGFAHLFEHLMFEGTPNAPRGLFDRLCEGSGGQNNGQTRPDVTVYVATAPVEALDRLLWLEADRMAALDFSEETLATQRDVVKEEILANVRNDPYGLFEFQELPGLLFERWESAHDAYGDFTDLDAATLDDVRAFFAAHYRPNNAVLAVAGDVEPDALFRRAEELFGALPAGPLPPRPDLLERRRNEPAIAVREAPMAETPALAAGWRTPPRDHRDAWPLLVLGEILHDGRAGRLHAGLVEGREVATTVEGGVNPFQGGLWYDGTTLFLSKLAYRRGIPHEVVLGALDDEVRRIAQEGVPDAELARSKTKVVSAYLSSLESRLERSLEVAQATAFDGAPGAVNELPARVEAVTSEDLSRAASGWLRSEQRAVVVKLPPTHGSGATA